MCRFIVVQNYCKELHRIIFNALVITSGVAETCMMDNPCSLNLNFKK